MSKKEEVVAYLEQFLAILKNFTTQQRDKEASSIDISKIRQAPSLTEARNIAKKLILDLFSKYKISAKEVAEI